MWTAAAHVDMGDGDDPAVVLVQKHLHAERVAEAVEEVVVVVEEVEEVEAAPAAAGATACPAQS